MARTKFETIKLEASDRAATVTMNRPEVRNAFHPSMIRELTDAFTQLAQRSDVSVIVLKGEGKSFCSGADLGYMKSMADFSLGENQTDAEQLFDMFSAIRNCPQPVIGRVHGHVMGGALGLTAVCDIVAAVAGTQFCFSEARLGLVPAVISPFCLEKMRPAAAHRYMLTAEVFGPDEAQEAGLVAFVGDETLVDAFVMRVTTTLLDNGPEAVRSTKKLLRSVYETQDWNRRRELTSRTIAERRVSEEGQEGLRGFLEKRQPKWKAK